jgi:hypothetical protein
LFADPFNGCDFNPGNAQKVSQVFQLQRVRPPRADRQNALQG